MGEKLKKIFFSRPFTHKSQVQQSALLPDEIIVFSEKEIDSEVSKRGCIWFGSQYGQSNAHVKKITLRNWCLLWEIQR